MPEVHLAPSFLVKKRKGKKAMQQLWYHRILNKDYWLPWLGSIETHKKKNTVGSKCLAARKKDWVG